MCVHSNFNSFRGIVNKQRSQARMKRNENKKNYDKKLNRFHCARIKPNSRRKRNIIFVEPIDLAFKTNFLTVFNVLPHVCSFPVLKCNYNHTKMALIAFDHAFHIIWSVMHADTAQAKWPLENGRERERKETRRRAHQKILILEPYLLRHLQEKMMSFINSNGAYQKWNMCHVIIIILFGH